MLLDIMACSATGLIIFGQILTNNYMTIVCIDSEVDIKAFFISWAANFVIVECQ